MELNLLGSTSVLKEHLITELMEKMWRIALIVHLGNTVKGKAMSFGQMIVQKDFTALVELTTLLQMMVSLESFAQLGITAQLVQQLPYHAGKVLMGLHNNLPLKLTAKAVIQGSFVLLMAAIKLLATVQLVSSAKKMHLLVNLRMVSQVMSVQLAISVPKVQLVLGHVPQEHT